MRAQAHRALPRPRSLPDPRSRSHEARMRSELRSIFSRGSVPRRRAESREWRLLRCARCGHHPDIHDTRGCIGVRNEPCACALAQSAEEM